MKTFLKCALLTSALAATPIAAHADEAKDEGIPGTFSGSVAVTTDYRFRGITQTQGDPALQAGITYTHPSGAYIGFWGSNVDFVDGDDAQLEIDGFFGYTNTVGKFGYDLGAIYYAYPGSNPAAVGLGKYSYWEIYFSPSYDFGVASIKGSIYYSPEFFGKVGDAIYYKAALAVPLPFLPYGAKIDGWGGYQDFFDLTGADYWDWSVGLGFTVEGFGLDFRYTDTNLKAPLSSPDIAGSRFVFTLSRGF